MHFDVVNDAFRRVQVGNLRMRTSWLPSELPQEHAERLIVKGVSNAILWGHRGYNNIAAEGDWCV